MSLELHFLACSLCMFLFSYEITLMFLALKKDVLFENFNMPIRKAPEIVYKISDAIHIYISDLKFKRLFNASIIGTPNPNTTNSPAAIVNQI